MTTSIDHAFVDYFTRMQNKSERERVDQTQLKKLSKDIFEGMSDPTKNVQISGKSFVVGGEGLDAFMEFAREYFHDLSLPEEESASFRKLLFQAEHTKPAFHRELASIRRDLEIHRSEESLQSDAARELHKTAQTQDELIKTLEPAKDKQRKKYKRATEAAKGCLWGGIALGCLSVMLITIPGTSLIFALLTVGFIVTGVISSGGIFLARDIGIKPKLTQLEQDLQTARQKRNQSADQLTELDQYQLLLKKPSFQKFMKDYPRELKQLLKDNRLSTYLEFYEFDQKKQLAKSESLKEIEAKHADLMKQLGLQFL